MQCECRAGMLLISIRDTGIGIEPHLTQVIFERFRQAETSLSRKYGGTGLGLSISRSYAEMMGGTISVNSTPGVGSLFTISLPYTPPIEMVQNTITDNDVPIEIPNWKDKVILLAEDDEDSSYLTDQILLETGITIIQVENGNEAVEKCKTNDAIQLVLMDMGLPGINGFEATPLIKSMRPDLPVIAVTAYALTGDRERCLEAGCDDYLAKPIGKEQLMKMMAQYLGS